MSFEGGTSCRNSVTTDFFTEARGDQNIRVLPLLRLLLQRVKDYLGFPGTLWETTKQRRRHCQERRGGALFGGPQSLLRGWE